MKKLLIILAAAICLWGCATLISGTTQTVTFVSNPAGATVYDNGFPVGRTPLMAQLERKDIHMISIEAAGYQPFQIVLRQQFNGWYLGNLLLSPVGLGIIGLIIDPITGAIYSLTPDYVGVDMGGAQLDSAPQQTPQKSGNKDELVLDIVLVPIAPNAAGVELIGQLVKK